MAQMMSTTFTESVRNVTGFYNDLIHNPFYTFNDKKPVIATYYNINKDYSSLDPGSKLHYDDLGKDSPITFNVIYDTLLFGGNKVELNVENDEFGIEADKITGEYHILPNTFIPTEGDYFELDHIENNSYLFQVNDVQPDTLDNGANAYKISFTLSRLSNEEIQQNIVNRFRMIESREGTNIISVVRCEDYDIAVAFNERATMLKAYYKELFYNEKVQTFIFSDLTGYHIYDPYMIEFLIRNKILENDPESYIYINHKIKPVATFGINYNRTFFRAFEKNNVDALVSSNRTGIFNKIKTYAGTFATRYEDYFSFEYTSGVISGYGMNCVPDDFVFRVKEKTYFSEENDVDNYQSNLWKNIIIKYFSGDTISKEELECIDSIDIKCAKEAFYFIPLLIFCLEKAIENALK